MQPDYLVPVYRSGNQPGKATLDRVFRYLDSRDAGSILSRSTP